MQGRGQRGSQLISVIPSMRICVEGRDLPASGCKSDRGTRSFGGGVGDPLRENRCGRVYLLTSVMQQQVTGYCRMIEIPEKPMKRIGAILILAVVSLSFLPPNAAAKTPSPKSEARAARKATKRQQKAQKKYIKAQKKAQKKMIKKDRKNTHLPSHY